jgi:hypothetical protein
VVDQRTGALVHPPTGRSFSIGDRVWVTIAQIDLALRKLDLVITDPKNREAGKDKQLKPRGGIERAEGKDGWDGPTGADRRSRKSKSRDKGKTDFRADRKKKKRR